MTLFAVSTPSAPDIDGVLLPPQVVGDEVTLSMKVYNYGDAPAPAFTVDIYHNLGSAPGPSQKGDYQFAVPEGLPSLGHILLQYSFGPLPDGTFQAWIYADRNNVTGDQDASNNVAGPGVFQYPPAFGEAKPDLIVSAVETYNAYGELRYDIEVQNAGQGPAQGVDLHLFYDQEQNPSCWDFEWSGANYDTIKIDVLEPGQKEMVHFTWPWPAEGEHSSWVKTDCYELIGEANENNNDVGPMKVNFSSEIQGVDLVVSQFTADVDCGAVAYIVEVTNEGDVDAPPFQVDIFYDGVEAPGFGVNGDFSKVFDGLKAGETVGVPHIRLGAGSGAQTSWLVVDTLLEVSETNFVDGPNVAEVNNLASTDLWVGEGSCVCPNGAITAGCECGAVKASEGFCCGSVWSPNECAESATPPEETAGGSGNMDPPSGEGASGDGAGSGDGDGGGSGDGTGGGNSQFGAPAGAWNNMNGEHGGVVDPDTSEAARGCSAGSTGTGRSPWSLVAFGLLLVVVRRRRS